MKIKTVSGLFISLAAAASLIRPSIPAYSEELSAEEGILFRLNQDGLNFLSHEIRGRVLTPVRNLPLPDINTTVDYGIRVKASDLRLSLDFTSLQLRPGDGQLAVTLGLKNLKIQVPKIRASKKVIWEIATTCTDTRIEIASHNPLPVSATIPLWVDQGEVGLNLNNIEFRIPDQEFRVDGPGSCSGALGIGHLIRAIVSNILDDSKETIRRAIVDNVRKLAPALSQELNNITHQSIDLGARPVPVLPALNGQLNLSPYDVQISTEAMNIAFSLSAVPSVSPAGKNTDDFRHNLKNSTLLGLAGINPQIIREIFKIWVRDYPDGFELNEELLSEAAPLLDPTFAATVWPELLSHHPSRDDLKLRLRFGEAPALTWDADQGAFILQSEAIWLSLLVRQNDQFRPFYHLRMNVTAATILTLDGDLLLLRLAAPPNHSQTGFWPEGYQPDNPLVREDLLSRVTGRMISQLYRGDEPLYMMFVPTLFTGNSYLLLDNLRYQAPYITVSVLSTDSP